MTLKQKAIESISKLPDDASLEDMMYRLYVIDKVEKGMEELRDGSIVTSEDLQKEIDSW